MKLKAIAKLIKNNKYIYTVEETEKSFWLGNGTAIYLVDGLPLMTNEQLLIMFEIPEKDKPKYHFSNNLKFTSQIERKDCIQAESIALMLNMTLQYSGYTLVPLRTEAGLICIEEQYLKPLASLEQGYELYLRYTDENKPYIVAKDGMFMKAVILPCNVVDKFFCAGVGEILNLSTLTAENGNSSNEAESFLHGRE
ncbi:MAG: hypothetical protein IKL10_04840 [Clostridia bacterium]|nr:hypothetical protein [Clostridia bacterium]